MILNKVRLWAVVFSFLGLTVSRLTVGAAESPRPTSVPWEKVSVSFGSFISAVNSNVTVGSGLGVNLDVEKSLGLETQMSVFRTETFWRFSENRRHRLDASWFALRRRGDRTVGQDFEITDKEGQVVTINAGTHVESHFNLDIIQTAYSYSFLQDDRVDLAAVVGFFVMPIDFGLKSNGLADGDGQLRFAAPLPVVGYRLDLALTPKWFIRTGTQIFYVQYKSFTGRLTDIRGAVEYLPLKNVAVGVGFDAMRIGVESRGHSYHNTTLDGAINLESTGVQLYGRFFF